MKYTELVEKWTEARKQFQDYEMSCGTFAAKVFLLLKENFDLKDDKLFKLIDPDEQDVNTLTWHSPKKYS